MRLLLVHQNFQDNFEIWDLHSAIEGMTLKRSAATSVYPIRALKYCVTSTILVNVRSPYSLEVDEWIHRSEKVANLAMGLKQRGGLDVMLAHPGWGKHLLRQVFPSTPLVIWPELWLRPEHMGIDPASSNVGQMQYIRIKDWLVDGAMHHSRSCRPDTKQAHSQNAGSTRLRLCMRGSQKRCCNYPAFNI